MKNTPPTTLKDWMSIATSDEQETLAFNVGSSRAMLYQYSGGFRSMSADRAGAVEDATWQMHKHSGGRLPVVKRTELCGACASCPYASPNKLRVKPAQTPQLPLL